MSKFDEIYIYNYIRETETSLLDLKKFLFLLLWHLNVYKDREIFSISHFDDLLCPFIIKWVLDENIWALVYDHFWFDSKSEISRVELLKELINFPSYLDTFKYWESIYLYFHDYIQDLYSLLSTEKEFLSLKWVDLCIKNTNSEYLSYYPHTNLYFLDSQSPLTQVRGQTIEIWQDGLIDFTESFESINLWVPWLSDYILEKSLLKVNKKIITKKYKDYLDQEILKREDTIKTNKWFDKLFWMTSKEVIITRSSFEREVNICIFFLSFIENKSTSEIFKIIVWVFQKKWINN